MAKDKMQGFIVETQIHNRYFDPTIQGEEGRYARRGAIADAHRSIAGAITERFREEGLTVKEGDLCSPYRFEFVMGTPEAFRRALQKAYEDGLHTRPFLLPDVTDE